jgi:phage host-nuclease inhibitor protein Gam
LVIKIHDEEARWTKLSDTPMAIQIPRTKREANELIKLHEAKERQKALNKAKLEEDNLKLEEEQEEIQEALAVYGSLQLPADLEAPAVKSINFWSGRRIYRRASTQVVFTRKTSELVKEFLKRPFWIKRFVKMKVTFSIDRDAIKNFPYIIKKIDGIAILEVNNLYLRTSGTKPKDEGIVLQEHIVRSAPSGAMTPGSDIESDGEKNTN